MLIINNRSICESCFAEINSELCPQCGFSKMGYSPDPAILKCGTILMGRYIIGRVIGKGGFGITYLAYDAKLDITLAVKEYYPYGLASRAPGQEFLTVSEKKDEEIFKRGAEKFYSEARLVAKFNGNPNIVAVHDFFYENDTAYYVMEYLKGQTLSAYVAEKGAVTVPQAVYTASEIANALMAAHNSNILHRDISPDNIMLCGNGGIKLLDFGAARQVVSEKSSDLSVILKQGFAPLEQYQRKGKQGPWTDIYSLGATLYYAISGNLPDDPMSRLDDDSEFEENRLGIDPEFWAILDKSLKIRCKDRYQNIFEFINDLNAISVKPEPIIKPEPVRIPFGSKTKVFGSADAMPLTVPASREQKESGDMPLTMPASREQKESSAMPLTMPASREQTESSDMPLTMPASREQKESGAMPLTMPASREQKESGAMPLTMPASREQKESGAMPLTMPASREQKESGAMPLTMPASREQTESSAMPLTMPVSQDKSKYLNNSVFKEDFSEKAPYAANTEKKKGFGIKQKCIVLLIAVVVLVIPLCFLTGDEKVTIGGHEYSVSIDGKLDLRSKKLTEEDIKNLKYMKNVTSLDLSYNNFNDLIDLSPLSSMKNLKELNLSHNPELTDFSSLSGLEKLTDLNLNSNTISDLSFIAKLNNLQYLDLGNCEIDDISDLSGLKNLKYLYLENNNISDISALSGLVNLEELYLYGNGAFVYEPLKKLTKLETLYLNSTAQNDISIIWDTSESFTGAPPQSENAPSQSENAPPQSEPDPPAKKPQSQTTDPAPDSQPKNDMSQIRDTAGSFTGVTGNVFLIPDAGHANVLFNGEERTVDAFYHIAKVWGDYTIKFDRCLEVWLEEPPEGMVVPKYIGWNVNTSSIPWGTGSSFDLEDLSDSENENFIEFTRLFPNEENAYFGPKYSYDSSDRTYFRNANLSVLDLKDDEITFYFYLEISGMGENYIIEGTAHAMLTEY